MVHDSTTNPSSCESQTWRRHEFFQGGFAGVALLTLNHRIAVIWIETGICTGCAEALFDEDCCEAVRLEFQETLMDRSRLVCADRLRQVQADHAGNYVLVVDGAIPTGPYARISTLGTSSDGTQVTAEELATLLATQAAMIVALGTCSSWGGIPSSGNNPFGYRSLKQVVGRPVVRIPGCPPNAAWVAGTLSAALGFEPLELDDRGRLKRLYGRTVHDQCPRRPMFDSDQFAQAPGDPSRCLLAVGCKGTVTQADCPTRGWNGNQSCLGANQPCIGCASPGFPYPKTDRL